MPTPVVLKTKKEVVLLRNSERGVFKGCRQRWWWSYVDCLVPKGQPPKALAFGTLVHQALAAYYIPGRKRGPHPTESFRQFYLEFVDEFGRLNMRSEEDWVDALDMGSFMLDSYVKEYGNEEDRWEVISPELSCQVDVNDPDTGEYLFTYVFTVDAAVIDLRHDKVGMLEHKTSASAEKPGTPIWLDEQGRSYWTFGEPWLIFNGYISAYQSVEFLVYNILRKAMPDTRPKNERGLYLNKPTAKELKAFGPDYPGSVSKKQPPKYFNREFIFVTDEERLNMFNRVLAEFKEMQMVKRGELQVIKNPSKDCNFCPFRDMCELHESGNDWESIKEEMYNVGDPYSDHRGMDTEVE